MHFNLENFFMRPNQHSVKTLDLPSYSDAFQNQSLQFKIEFLKDYKTTFEFSTISQYQQYSFRSDALANYSFKREFSTSEIEYIQMLQFIQI